MSDPTYELKAKEPKKRNLGLILLIILALSVSVYGLTQSLEIPSLGGSPTETSLGTPVPITATETAFSTEVQSATQGETTDLQIVWIVKSGVLQAPAWEYVDPANPPSTEGYLQTQILCDTGSFDYPIPVAQSVFMLKPVTPNSGTILEIIPGLVHVVTCTPGDTFTFNAQ